MYLRIALDARWVRVLQVPNCRAILSEVPQSADTPTLHLFLSFLDRHAESILRLAYGVFNYAQERNSVRAKDDEAARRSCVATGGYGGRRRRGQLSDGGAARHGITPFSGVLVVVRPDGPLELANTLTLKIDIVWLVPGLRTVVMVPKTELYASVRAVVVRRVATTFVNQFRVSSRIAAYQDIRHVFSPRCEAHQLYPSPAGKLLIHARCTIGACLCSSHLQARIGPSDSNADGGTG